jgi:hypothetical protein
MWQTKESADKIKESKILFFEKNGYWPGTDNESIRKRKETMVERYGVSHNWIGKYGDRKCDKTTINLYGKSAADMLMEYSHHFGKKTDIEIIFEDILHLLPINNYEIADDNFAIEVATEVLTAVLPNAEGDIYEEIIDAKIRAKLVHKSPILKIDNFH